MSTVCENHEKVDYSGLIGAKVVCAYPVVGVDVVVDKEYSVRGVMSVSDEMDVLLIRLEGYPFIWFSSYSFTVTLEELEKAE